MIEDAVQYLICPDTLSPLRLEVSKWDGQYIIEGQLINVDDDSKHYPIIKGVPRFVDINFLPTEQKSTVDTFSFKWSYIPNYAGEEGSKDYREKWYFERFGFSHGDQDVQKFLGNAKYLLEAGTGTGVDTDMLTRNSAGLIFGIDISTAIDTAYERFHDNNRVVLLQADIGRLPFRSDFFDVISCDQVLHHTPNPPQNFQRLCRLLNGDGKLLLYVYKVKGPLREYADDLLRNQYTNSSVEDCIDFSARITRFGHNLSNLNAKVEIEDDIPELGIKKGVYDVQRLIYDHIVKCYWNPTFDFDTNVMVNFDWYRPLHAFRYTKADIENWASVAGMKLLHIDISPSGISTIMQKPKNS